MKGYWVAHVTVTDPDKYGEYVAASAKAFKKFKANILARGGNCKGFEGNTHARNVIIEFASYHDALACYQSEEYQNAKKLREGAGVADIVITEGV